MTTLAHVTLRPLTGNEQLKYAGTLDRFFNDPDLTDRALLLVMTANRLFAAGEKDIIFRRVMDLVGWDTHTLKTVFREDCPRYTPDRSQIGACANPMIRRDGPCGRPTSWKELDFRDPDTGETTVRGACSRHWPELQSQHRENRADWLAAGSPKPTENTGGVLPRYLKVDDWHSLYRASGAWPGDRYRFPEPPPSAPKLSVLTTEDPETTPTARPALTIVQ